MSKVTFNIPSEVKKMLSSHPEIHWERLVRDTLWSYAKKIESFARPRLAVVGGRMNEEFNPVTA